MKNKSIIAVITLVVVGIVFFGASAVEAQNDTAPFGDLAQKIATKFGVDQTEVVAVFEEHRQERQSQMQARFEERLNQYVTEGKLTQDQKALILAKHQELRSERLANQGNWQNLTPEERQSQMQAQHEEMETWANANGIDTSIFFGLGGNGQRMQGFRHR